MTPPIIEASRELEPKVTTGIGWDGKRLDQMLAESDTLFAQTGRYQGLERLELKESDPIGFEKLFSRVRGGLVSARETALNISASPIVRELGELCFALYTPEGDSVGLSTGIIVHVHTMSEALKYFVRNGWEDNPGVRPGDIFANNDPVIGDVHPADVQTFVPIFWEGELIAWAGGVTHVLDIGASTPGGVPVGPTTIFEDGIDLHGDRIGENDELSRAHLERVKRMTRTPMYYLLDEKTRLAGCHMIRDAVERLILDEGVDRVKQFMREVIEDTRRSFKATVRRVTVPGRYRAPGFVDTQFADKTAMPDIARRDFIMHGCYEMRFSEDGTMDVDLDGSSAWGWHSMNATPAGVQGMTWLVLTQGLICNDKINDGGYLATRGNYPEGTWANKGDAICSSSVPWPPLFVTFTGYVRGLSRALQSRGFIEEVMTSYGHPAALQGGGIDQYGNTSGFMNFEFAGGGMGAKYVLDGLDYGAAPFNPEGDHGDCEMWELITPFLYLGRQVKASTGGPGRHRGGSGFESLFMTWNTPFFQVQQLMESKMFCAPGIFGGYPAATGYAHSLKGTDLIERAKRGEAYPTGDGSYDEPALFELTGRRTYVQDGMRTLEPAEVGDLFQMVYKGGGGLGDPLLRPVDAVSRDVEEGHLLAPYAESVYAVSAREDAFARRLERAVPVSEWWAKERGRIRAADLIEPVQVMYAESMRLSPRFAAEYRGFWDLPEDFEFDVRTPTVTAQRSEWGKLAPKESAAAYLADAQAFTPAGDLDETFERSAVSHEELADMLDEKLSRRAVKDIQSAFKDARRFDTWLGVLQKRVDYDDPIVLPLGEGLNIVKRRSDGEYVVRTDAGADLCRWDENWKMHAVVHVRDSEEAMREIYPQMGHADPHWMELREFYCPLSGRLLEVEAVPPGYPVVHDFLPDLKGFYEGWLGRPLP
jgi:N-methylhydantoinase B/oxoprolinase/acetone carboxylase alpha subunit/acetone carboxylase gamma subunit